MSNKEETLNFIDDYKSHSALWDVNHRNYANKQVRLDLLTLLGSKYGLSIDAVKKKIKSLRSYFSKEHQRLVTKKSGSGTEENSTWFAYNSLLFIRDTIVPKETVEVGLEEDQLETAIEFDESVYITSPTSSDENPRPTKRSRNLKKKNVIPDPDPQVEEAYGFMKAASESIINRDECSIFFVAAKIRKFTPRNKAIIQNKINNLIFEMEMEELASTGSIASPSQASPFQNYQEEPIFVYVSQENQSQAGSNDQA